MSPSPEHAAIADPFRPTADLVDLLHARAAQLRRVAGTRKTRRTWIDQLVRRSQGVLLRPRARPVSGGLSPRTASSARPSAAPSQGLGVHPTLADQPPFLDPHRLEDQCAGQHQRDGDR